MTTPRVSAATVLQWAVLHGIARKTWHLYDAKEYDFNTGKEEDLLYTTRLCIGLIGTLSNVVLWPVNIMRDVQALEGRLRGRPYSSYLERISQKSRIDYFLA